MRLTDKTREGDKPYQVETVSKGGRGNESGVNAAARELGVNKNEAHRSVKIASISTEAKQAAIAINVLFPAKFARNYLRAVDRAKAAFCRR